MDTLFIIMQHLLPQHLLSRLTGWLADNQTAWLKNLLIERFIAHFNVDMREAVDSQPRNYASFNDFFTRALAEGARPLASDPDSLLNPADGCISQIGKIEQGRIFQAKGQTFSVRELLGGATHRSEPYLNGDFATIYLSPRDYHRVHMPASARLVAQTYVPGDLYSVNQTTAENVDRLFARNERLVCHFETEHGPMVMVLVGALIVAGIETVWGGQVAPVPRQAVTTDFTTLPDPVNLQRGEEMGRFKLGSTVIVLFPPNQATWLEGLQSGSPTRMGTALATRVSTA